MDRDFRWWEGWDPEEIWRVACFVIPGLIIMVWIAAHLTGGT